MIHAPEAARDFDAAPGGVETLAGVGALLDALGRGLLCLDRDFAILHASSTFDRLLGPGTAAVLRGLPAELVLGDLLAPGGALRLELAAGRGVEGWAATLRLEPLPQALVAVSAAPVPVQGAATCDARIAYVALLRSVGPGATKAVDDGAGAAERAATADAARARLLATLAAHRWRREEAATALGISRTTLWRRMRELGL